MNAPPTRRRQHGGGADQRRLEDLARAEPVHVPADEQRDRDRAAMVNVPQALPGTSRRASSGRTRPWPLGFRFRSELAGHRQVEALVEDHALARPVAESIGRSPRGSDRSSGRRRIVIDSIWAFGSDVQHGPGLHRDLLAAQGLDDHDPQPGQGDDHDVEDGDRRGQPGGAADLAAGQPGEAQAAAAGRGGQHHHVLHGPGQADAHHQPDQARHVAELDRQHRPDQRARARDRREMVAEEHPAIGRVEVLAVAGTDGRA